MEKKAPSKSEINTYALRYLERREHTRFELKTKLSRKGFEEHDILKALTDLERRGLLSQERYIEDYIESRIRKGYGPNRIKMELVGKRLSAEEIEVGMQATDTDWLENAHCCYAKKYREPIQDNQDKAKRMQYLYRQGYPQEIIREVLEASQLTTRSDE